MARTTITIPADLLADAKAFGLNLSRYVQQKLGGDIARLKAERWYSDNKEAIDAYNERVRTEGPALARQRTW